MCFDEAKATDTERFIIKALLEGCGTLDQLGRGTREKIKRLLSDYVKTVEINEEDYNKVLSQVNGYKTGARQIDVTDIDQPPQRDADTPAWIREAERAEYLE